MSGEEKKLSILEFINNYSPVLEIKPPSLSDQIIEAYDGITALQAKGVLIKTIANDMKKAGINISYPYLHAVLKRHKNNKNKQASKSNFAKAVSVSPVKSEMAKLPTESTLITLKTLPFSRQIELMWTEIENMMRVGYSAGQIVEYLNKQGIAIALGNFRKIVARIRAKSKKIQQSSRVPTSKINHEKHGNHATKG